MFFLILFLLTIKCDAASRHYECGVHGRFEYCIDDFPGCVIGCHCYPGYYFDTDSKICEPNTKLTQDYRRHLTPIAYNHEGSNQASALVVPTPAPLPELPASPDEPAPNTNTGDLSDWLYNQFFKTIESQVVNKTDDEPLTVQTRRSGAPIEPFIARRHTNRRKKYRKRKKISRKDDDSDEESTSGSGSSESDSDDSKGDLGSWERFEWGPQQSPNGPGAPKDGAHRQIVMYSKKPKPPLPSFIFLPNMGTAFYPPLGLPAPAIPMYPMVPIPPIHSGQPDYENNETTSATTTHAATSHEPTTAPTTQSQTADSTITTTNTYETTTTTTTKTTTTAATTQLKYLRSHNLNNRFKNRHKPPPRPVFKPSQPPPPMFDYPMNQDNDYDAMFMGDSNGLLDQEGPDFKYISELIHRNHNESTSQLPPVPNPKRYEQFFGFKPSMPQESRKRRPIMPGRLDSTRRRFDPRKNGEDDTYYSSLGKQIAKLVRGLDPETVPETDGKFGPNEDPKSAHPFFSEGSYAARTYWERFVRSPLSLRLKNFTKYEDLIASNENLFELENQVQEATSAPALNWLELENLINTMGTIRKDIHDKTLNKNYDKSSNSSLNFSLLPRYSARVSLLPQKSVIKTNAHTLLATFDEVIGTLNKSDRQQKYAKKVHKNKTDEVNKHSEVAENNSLAYNPPRSIQYKTKNIHNLPNFVPTLKPTLLTALNKYELDQAKVDHDNHNIDIFNEVDHKHRLISVGGETTFVKTKKYFFDGGAFQYENWA